MKNSQMHRWPASLHLIAFFSADVISHG